MEAEDISSDSVAVLDICVHFCTWVSLIVKNIWGIWKSRKQKWKWKWKLKWKLCTVVS